MPHSDSCEKKGGHVCPHQMSFMLDNWFRRWVQNPKRIAGEYVREGATVLDLGCGPGYFSIDLAKMVGDTGKVFAVDIQESMLVKVRKKAEKHGVTRRMVFHRCGPDRIGLEEKTDFVLAYYLIHETPDPRACFLELKTMLKKDGRILVVEPRMHVSRAGFERTVADAVSAGLRVVEIPKGKGGRSVLLGI